MSFTLKQTYVEVLPEGTYDAVVADIELKSDGKFGDGTYLKWYFGLEGNLQKSMTTSAKFSNKSNLYKYLRAIWQKEIPRDYLFNPDDVIGLPCQVIIVHDVDDDGTTWDQVDRVLGPRKGAMPVGTEHESAQTEIPF